jgi:hypothetical protein
VESQKRVFWVRLERGRESIRDNSGWNLSSSHVPARDTVRLSKIFDQADIELSHGPYTTVAEISFPGVDHSLRNICLLLDIFATASPNYNPWTEQCFWFCSALMRIVHPTFFAAQLVEGSAFQKQGAYLVFSVGQGDDAANRIQKRFLEAITSEQSRKSNPPKLYYQ